ncbi:MAG: polysaccharide biosynthesis/export family protein, partial [Pseudomonadota bacterium]
MVSQIGTQRFQRGAMAASRHRSKRDFETPSRMLTALSGLAVLAFVAAAVFTPLRPPLHAGAELGALNYAGPTEGEYRLGPQDKIRVQVFEWRPARDEIFAWDALNAEYSIGVSGNLALPLVGQIPADGKTTGELAASISTLLQQRDRERRGGTECARSWGGG